MDEPKVVDTEKHTYLMSGHEVNVRSVKGADGTNWWVRSPSGPRKPTVVFDFDGVIHSYTSGWKGATEIPDPPVPGIREAIQHIRLAGYRVVVVSTRCCGPEGMGAVRRYLRDNRITVDDVMMEKPPAVCYIDDRAICFDGHPETLLEKIVNFKPWNYSGEREEKDEAPVHI